MKKAFLLILLLVSTIIFTSACVRSTKDQKIDTFISNTMSKNSDSNVNVLNSNKKTIVFIYKIQGSHFSESVAASAKQICNNAGYNFIIDSPKDPEQNIDEQIKLIKEYTASKVNGIMIIPANNTSIIPALKNTQGNKIPILNIDTIIDGTEAKKNNLNPVPFVGINNENASYQSVKYAISNVTSKSNALIISGNLTQQNARERRDGALKALKENSNINITDTVDGQWKKELGYSISKEEFSKHPDINIVVCGNDDTALGVIQYIKEKNISNVIVTGFDASGEGKQAIKDGLLKASVEQSPISIGKKSAESMIDLINGKQISNNILIDTNIINKSNANN